MVHKSFLIGPFESGLQNNVEPWLIPEDAFEELTNAYIWRGRVRKRFGTAYIGGSELNARLRIKIGTTDATGSLASTIMPGAIFAIGQMFSIGSVVFTVVLNGVAQLLLTTGQSSGTYSTTNGALIIIGVNNENPTTAVYFYPSEPVMGLRLRETANINFESTIGFDTQFAYQRSGGGWEILGPIPPAANSALWTGSNAKFHWTTNYRGVSLYETYLYVVNYTAADKIKYLPSTTSVWTTLRPQLNLANNRFLESAAIILGFKDRLLLLNTIENEGGADRVHQNRARWSQNGDPTVAATSWLDDKAGKGGYIDMPTEQAIISAEFIRDRLIVYCERSTWELLYTGEATLPFRWQQLNNELGAEGRFSVIGFDSQVVGVGNVGVHSCNGVNVSRIDQKIPDEVFKIHNDNDGPQRVYGIRDYYRELVYWCFPSFPDNPTFPDKILVWNYQNNTWAFFDEGFTCFGYLNKDSDLNWASVGASFINWAGWNASWGGAQSQSQFPDILAGNQQGVVFIIDADDPSAEKSLYITDINTATNLLTVINHNLESDDYVLVTDVQGISSPINNTVYQVTNESANGLKLSGVTYSGVYTGGGKLTKIANITIVSKQWNPGTPEGMQFNIPYIDLLLDKTSGGEISLNYIIDNTAAELPGNGQAILGTNVVFTKPETLTDIQQFQSKIWHRYFTQTQAQFLKIKIFFSDNQMKDTQISQHSDFQINAIIIYIEPQGRIIG